MSVKCDIILAGVGGQGVLSLGFIIAASAMEEKLRVKQSEVHGMSQRGGAVMAHLRISDTVIASDLIPKGKADLIISMEPVESLRYLPFLRKEGTLITATTPVLNIPDYPPIEELMAAIRALPHAILVDTARLARAAGSLKSANMVLIGCASPLLPIRRETIERFVEHRFESKGADVVEANRKAFAAGRMLADGAASPSS